MRIKKNTFTEFNCSNCGKLASKKNSAFNKNLRISGNNFCCLSCANSFNGRKDPTRRAHMLECSKKGISFRKSTFALTLRSARSNLSKRTGEKLEFTIDHKYLKELWETQKGICPYTKIQLILPTIYDRIKDKTIRASLDRIDSDKGYILGNVQFVSTPINLMKNTMSNEETINFINTIVTNINKENLPITE